MGYEDMFGSYNPSAYETDDMVTPLDSTYAAQATPQEQPVLTFDGFGSRNPLFMERPTRYVKRISDAMANMLILPEDDLHGGLYAREFYSPAVALPFPYLYGNEYAVSESAAKYPLLHFPQGHDGPVGDESEEHFVLSLIFLYLGRGLMLEDKEGTIGTFGVDDPVIIEPEVWDYATRLADELMEPIGKVNLCRLGLFSRLGSEEEKAVELDMYLRLLNAWNVEPDFDKIYKEAMDSVDVIAEHYHEIIPDDVPFKPFQEVAWDD